jgi:hypothetical protein
MLTASVHRKVVKAFVGNSWNLNSSAIQKFPAIVWEA